MNKMKHWQIVCVIIFIASLLISRKTCILKIILEQFKIYKNDKTKRLYWLDIITFIIAPLVIGVIVALNLPLSKIVYNADTVITVFSLIVTLPLSFLAMLIDRVLKNKKAEEVAKETFVSITIDILYAMIIIGVVIFASLTPLTVFWEQIVVGLIAFFTVKMVLNILMILKRVFNSY